MHRRLIILSAIIVIALCSAAWLGYHSIRIWAEGMEGARLGEFAAVAEQIRRDVMRKLDDFMAAEQKRHYGQYSYNYVPEDVVRTDQQMPLVRSPLSEDIAKGLAYGYFQIEPDSSIITPYRGAGQRQQRKSASGDKVLLHISNIKQSLLPMLNGGAAFSYRTQIGKTINQPKSELEGMKYSEIQSPMPSKGNLVAKKSQRAKRSRSLSIESLQSKKQKAQVVRQSRAAYDRNISSNEASQMEMAKQPSAMAPAEASQTTQQSESKLQADNEMMPMMQQGPGLPGSQRLDADLAEAETVQVRIEPFVPIVVPDVKMKSSIFGGQVFLLRHVQIEDRHFMQGFLLDEKKLIAEVAESAGRFMGQDMAFELSQAGNGQVAYTAILDFGFSDLVLNLKELDPGRIVRQIGKLRNWYFSIISVVLLAVTLALVSLWQNARAQLKLAQKKDDFISAVSHELRTPLTSIRMYSEMLEKDWIKSQDKKAEYYKSMRQESERLSRLIDNVLDFSRIQRDKKKYVFQIGQVNDCVEDVIKMMRPYAAQHGFSIKAQLAQAQPFLFDSDAVTQIVVNLLDNAVKYARNAADKIIIVRTRSEGQFVLIEVEDRGPGVPHRQRKKVFEEFYRCGSENTRETAGTGLGLALVRKFAQAHNGFVQILSAKPAGIIFRVALRTA